jgi:hypothetical protein
MTWARAPIRHAPHGQVYLRQPEPAGQGGAAASLAMAAGFAALVVAVVAIVASDALVMPGTTGQRDAELAGLIVAVAAPLFIWALFRIQQRGFRRQLIRAAYRACGEPGDAAARDDHEQQAEYQACLDELAALCAGAEPLPEDLLIELERAYSQLIEIIVADGVVEPHELDRLRRVEAALDLPPERVQAARVQGFLDIYDAAIEDHVLTRDEQDTLDHIRAALEVPESLVKKELAFARQLASARAARHEEPRPVPVAIRLHEGERALHMTTATRTKRVARAVPQGGQRRIEHVFEPMRAGDLYITSERLLFQAAGKTAIDLADIREVGLEAERKHLMVVRDGRKNPYFFEVPQPFVTQAYLERVLQAAWPGSSPVSSPGPSR